MSHGVTILVSVVLSLLSESCGAAVGVKTQSQDVLLPILSEIQSEIERGDQFCPTPREILESDYVKRCNEISYPSGNLTFTKENADTFLCLGLYDRAYHICHSRSAELKIPVLTNKTAFDAVINNNINSEDSDVMVLCRSLETMQGPLYNRTRPFVDQLITAFSKNHPTNCAMVCWNDERQEFNPLCFVIQIIDDEIQKEKNLKEKPAEKEVKPVEEPKEKVADQTTKAVDTKPVNPPSHPQSDEKPAPPENLEHPDTKSTKNNQLNDASVEAPKKAGSAEVKPPEKAPDVKEKAKVNSATQVQAPSEAKEASSVKKVEPKKSGEADGGASQIALPAENLPVEKSSTVSENTGDFGSQGDMNYDDPNQGILPPDPGEDEKNLPSKDANNLEEPIQDTFEQKDNVARHSRITPDDDSHFFGYFTIFGLLSILLCLAYHHKHKILAIVLEGRRSRGGRGRRRPSTASYRKLDCTLEEAVTSQCSSNVTHVIY